MTFTRTCSTALALLTLTLGASACGASDDEEIRANVSEWLELDRDKDADRACELMTPRARSQITGLLGSFAGDAGGSCVKVLSGSEPDEDQVSAGDIEKAKLAIRDARAVMSFPGDDAQRMGLRKVDGEWRLDNLINPSLRERPRRIDERLGEGSDEQQVRATAKAVSAAFAGEDYERACDLFSYGAEAQLLIGRLFASFGETESDNSPDLSCAASFRAIAKLAEAGDEDSGFAGGVPSAAELETARVIVDGDRATVKVSGEDPEEFVREEGHWRVAADSKGLTQEAAPTPASLERCWRRAGARIASSARDLRFAAGGHARHIAISPGRVSVKGPDWRIFYTLPAGGEDPGLAKVLAKPSTVRAVAYVEDAPAHARVVAKARDCGD